MLRLPITAEAIVSRKIVADAFTPSGVVQVEIELVPRGAGVASLTIDSPLAPTGRSEHENGGGTVHFDINSEKMLDTIDGLVAGLQAVREAVVRQGWLVEQPVEV